MPGVGDAHGGEAVLVRGLHGLVVEVPHDLHVVAHEAERHDHDGLRPGGGELGDRVVHVGLEPRLDGGPERDW